MACRRRPCLFAFIRFQPDLDYYSYSVVSSTKTVCLLALLVCVCMHRPRSSPKRASLYIYYICHASWYVRLYACMDDGYLDLQCCSTVGRTPPSYVP